MAVRIVRLGTSRKRGERLRLGTVRRPPRGVRREHYAKGNFFDVWLPELAPSAPLVSFAFAQPFTPARWAAFERRYRAEMKKPPAQRLIALLARLSAQTNFAVGCYCEDESHCHRSILRSLLSEHGAVIAKQNDELRAAR
jgi:uncharacterized protein YeaO (DUF488 family)